MGKKRLIDATDLVRRVLVERDKIPLEVVQRYSFGVPEPCRHGQAMRGGIRKALREIETSQTVDAVEVVRCKDCIHYDPRKFLPCTRLGLFITDEFFCGVGKKSEEVSNDA